jgi:aarF domain-containing kinase
METFKVASWEESEYSSSAAAFASILDVIREHEVTMPGHICAVLVTVLVLEGWSSKLAPEHSVLEEVKGVIAMDKRSWRDRMSGTVDQYVDWAPVLPALDAA